MQRDAVAKASTGILDQAQATSATGPRGAAGEPSQEAEQRVVEPKPYIATSDHGGNAADVLTRSQFKRLVEHMGNGAGPYDFLLSWRGDDNEVNYVKSRKVRRDQAAGWAHATCRGKSVKPMALSLFPDSGTGTSRWGALDFDAHDGNDERAMGLAMSAFLDRLNSERFLILENSGRGWHLFIIREAFMPCLWWADHLRGIAERVGATVAPGICELFPEGSSGRKAMRVPGTLNPSTGQCSRIAHETVKPLLSSLSFNRTDKLSDKEKETFFQSLLDRVPPELHITEAGTRNEQLCKLAGWAYRQCCMALGERLAFEQYERATVKPDESRDRHLYCFRKAWEGLVEKWEATLSDSERAVCQRLTGNDRTAFRIVHGWAEQSADNGDPDFSVSVKALGERLQMSIQAASKLRNRLVKAGVMVISRPHIVGVRSTSFRWTGCVEQRRSA